MTDHAFNQSADDMGYIGMREVWGGSEPFGLLPADRKQHVYCVGKSGTGKSSLLRNLILQDIEHGHGVGLIDPHGDLATDIIDAIPPWRMNDVLYLNALDYEYPVAFNLLYRVKPRDRPRVASGIVSAFKNVFRDSWGNRLEYILYASLVALLDCETASLLCLPRLLIDRGYRRWVVRQIRDPMVKAFWTNEFENYSSSFAQEAISPIQNKIGQFLLHPGIRNALSQLSRKLDPRFILDDKRIFIANLSKGLLGEDKANLLGSLLLTSFEVAAMSRANLPEKRRHPFHLVVDEFHNFASDSFASILAESRKYGLSIVLSSQHCDQTRENIRQAIFGNVGTIISFRVGGNDARLLAGEFGTDCHPNMFTSLANHEVMVRLLHKGVPHEPFRGRTLAPLRIRSGSRDSIIKRSREKYAVRKQVVEEKIDRWLRRRYR